MFKKSCLIPLFFLVFPAVRTLSATYPMPAPGNDVIGELVRVQAECGDTLENIGDHYEVGLHEMQEANPSLSNELSGGEVVIVPTQFVLPKYRKGVIINIAECRLYYFTADGKMVMTYPVGLGRKGWRTPTTATTVIRKTTNPTWTVPKTIRAYVFGQTGNWLPDSIPPGPENPLGPYAMYLGTHGYLIHGTNQPWTIGKLSSAGCIRLHNRDVTELYQYVKTGTPVKIIHQPYKAGWQNGRLYLEAHLPVNLNERPSDLNMVSAERSVLAATHNNGSSLSWGSIKQIIEQGNGIPELVDCMETVRNDSNSYYYGNSY